MDEWQSQIGFQDSALREWMNISWNLVPKSLCASLPRCYNKRNTPCYHSIILQKPLGTNLAEYEAWRRGQPMQLAWQFKAVTTELPQHSPIYPCILCTPTFHFFKLLELSLVDGQLVTVSDVTTSQPLVFRIRFTDTNAWFPRFAPQAPNQLAVYAQFRRRQNTRRSLLSARLTEMPRVVLPLHCVLMKYKYWFTTIWVFWPSFDCTAYIHWMNDFSKETVRTKRSLVNNEWSLRISRIIAWVQFAQLREWTAAEEMSTYCAAVGSASSYQRPTMWTAYDERAWLEGLPGVVDAKLLNY